MEGSIAGANYCRMGLNRAILKETLRRLHHKRRQQVVLANIICATRFKFFDEEGTLLQAQCPNGCGEVDSLDHLLECHKIGAADPNWSFEEKVDFLKSMAIRATRDCLVLPTPIPRTPGGVTQQAEEYEISLGSSETPGSTCANHDQSDEWSLEFDCPSENAEDAD